MIVQTIEAIYALDCYRRALFRRFKQNISQCKTTHRHGAIRHSVDDARVRIAAVVERHQHGVERRDRVDRNGERAEVDIAKIIDRRAGLKTKGLSFETLSR